MERCNGPGSSGKNTGNSQTQGGFTLLSAERGGALVYLRVCACASPLKPQITVLGAHPLCTRSADPWCHAQSFCKTYAKLKYQVQPLHPRNPHLNCWVEGRCSQDPSIKLSTKGKKIRFYFIIRFYFPGPVNEF